MESSPEEVAVAVAVAVASYSSSSTGTTTGGDGHAAGFTKRKRTKRLRAFPSPGPPPPPMPPGNIDEEDISYFSTTEEEEDMANCLILLAQGRKESPSSTTPREEKFTSRKFTETVTTAGAKAGFYVYECKTCNKCFPSFQALGGHRASHKKPKLVGPANPMTAPAAAKDNINNSGGDGLEIRMSSSFARSSPAAGNRLRVHECSICGSEFASGQALGGHMRRHRPVGPSAAAAAAVGPREEKKGSNSMLSLDLNLPAPSEENMAFAFIDQQRPMALVDCHY